MEPEDFGHVRAPVGEQLHLRENLSVETLLRADVRRDAAHYLQRLNPTRARRFGQPHGIHNLGGRAKCAVPLRREDSQHISAKKYRCFYSNNDTSMNRLFHFAFR